MSEMRFVEPQIVSTHFHIRSGDVVGDFGAGTGNFASVLSRLVGEEGKVYCFEVQKNLVDKLEDNIRANHLSNVSSAWVDIEEDGGTKLKDGALDVAICVNALFQTEDKSAALKEMTRNLRNGGKLFIIDWSESWGGLGPQPNHVLEKDDARAFAETCGLTFERDFDAGGHHYGLAFRK